MIIKTAILDNEKIKIKEFLSSFSLSMPDKLDKTFYIEDSGNIIGTISIDKKTIKCFALNSSYQGENLSSLLINEALSYFRINNIFEYNVYTKKVYKDVFISFGFSLIVETEKTVFLEGGSTNIFDHIKTIKKQMELFLNNDDFNSLTISSIVMNANPITLGHDYLISEASKNSDLVLLFILEEDLSYFTFKERYSYAYLVSKKYDNVLVLPSTSYIISYSTFPNYFLKKEEIETEYSLVDSLIFKNYFMKELNIKYRYVGTETKGYMKKYNEVLKDTLGDSLIEVERIKLENDTVSASTVRDLLNKGMTIEARKYLPREIRMFVGRKNDE